jgi:hypothetical protein
MKVSLIGILASAGGSAVNQEILWRTLFFSNHRPPKPGAVYSTGVDFTDGYPW